MIDHTPIDFLNLARLPARLNAAQAAAILGFKEHDIPVLIAAGLLKPLGNPAPNSAKYFAECEIQARRNDPKWLSKATQVIGEHWKKKNGTNGP